MKVYVHSVFLERRLVFKRAFSLLLVVVVASVIGCKEEVSRRPSGDAFAPGAPAPVFELESLSGKRQSLGDFKGKVVLLNFWATWCAPCVAEMPALERLQQVLREEGLVIVSINHDSPDARAEVERFARERGLSFEILLDPDLSLPPKYGITGFPESFFVGLDGTFLEFSDPSTKEQEVRIVSDRPWDSPAFVAEVRKLL